MSHVALPEQMHPFAQRSMFGLTQIRIGLPQLCRNVTRKFDQAYVVQVGHTQFGHTALTHAKEIARATQPQIFLRQAETIVRRLKYFQAFLGLYAGIGAQHIAIRLVLATPDAPTKLLQMSQDKTVSV